MPPECQLPVLVVFGPTASGKTDLAVSLFSRAASFFPGAAEIISADSMQVYRGMDIGTAKPDQQLLESLPHHLIDICNPSEQFSAADFVRLADAAALDIHQRGKLPVIMGGTAFYIKNFMFGLPETPVSDAAVRDLLQVRLRSEGAAVLHQELSVVDPVSAARIHIHDGYRITRALEVYACAGRPLSSFALCGQLRDQYRFLVIGLERPREELNRRITLRVDQMFDSGLEKEARALIEAGFGPEAPGMQAIGYREFFDASCDGNRREMIDRHTRLYAKRQLTFFRSLPGVQWFGAQEIERISETVGRFYGSSVLDGLSQTVHTS